MKYIFFFLLLFLFNLTSFEAAAQNNVYADLYVNGIKDSCCLSRTNTNLITIRGNYYESFTLHGHGCLITKTSDGYIVKPGSGELVFIDVVGIEGDNRVNLKKQRFRVVD
jgi:hypothetical protein